MKHIVIRAIDCDGKNVNYANTSGWTPDPGKAMYFPMDVEVSKLAQAVIKCYDRKDTSENVKISPVVIDIAVSEYDTLDADWLNAVREHAIKKLTSCEIAALGIEQYALFVKMAEQKKQRRRKT